MSSVQISEEQIISQGAEGRVYLLNDYFGKKCIVKERFSKKYRHPILDNKLTKQRLIREIKNIAKCRQQGIETPSIYNIDKTKGLIFMEYIEGCSVKHYLRQFENNNNNNDNMNVDHNNKGWNDNCLELFQHIGKLIGLMHKNKIIHGDLTTSNIMLRNEKINHIVMIDFGLSFITTLDEDKAVDLYVLERALLSTHPNSEQLFTELLKGYQQVDNVQSKTVIKKLEQVRLRGRKKSMVG
ncbi:hypothetical protein ABK040_007096 [Willaertia magna]